MKEMKRILIVDDDPHIRKLLRVNLAAEGYAVSEASDGIEVEQYLRSDSPPDLILLDVMMPNVDGWEVCKMIRDSKFGSSIRIVMITAKAMARDRMIGREILKADEYVTKPFDLDHLLEIMRRLLG